MTFISSITFILPTFLASTFFTLLAKKLAPKFGFIDVPDADRKRHATPTPVMGGIGMALGLITGLPITLLISATARSIWALHGTFFIAFVVTALTYCCLGAIDDRFGLRPITKLIGQITCAIPFLFFFLLLGMKKIEKVSLKEFVMVLLMQFHLIILPKTKMQKGFLLTKQNLVVLD